MEGKAKIGLAHDGQTVTLEPGGQTELSGAPLPDLHAVARETREHLLEVRCVWGGGKGGWKILVV